MERILRQDFSTFRGVVLAVDMKHNVTRACGIHVLKVVSRMDLFLSMELDRTDVTDVS